MMQAPTTHHPEVPRGIRRHPAAAAVVKIDERLTLVQDDNCGLMVIRTWN